MTGMRMSWVLVIGLATFGCGEKKKEDGPALPWTPSGYDKLSAICKRTLACCEEVAKSQGVTSAMDFNGKCSGPAMWKDADCEMDLKARVEVFESEKKPVPNACK